MASISRHSGRAAQTFIYLGKLFRMFVFQNDWKVLPMAAVISGLVSYVIASSIFTSMEGTIKGAFAISCICIWNGFFNSIQVICRERPIIKREHRSGLHMSSYIAAHMIYQAFLCLCQTIITIIVLNVANVSFPTESYVTSSAIVDIGITLFLTTYAADMTALFVSSIVKNTTAAMTVMPFLMIFQLIFSGGFFSLQGAALKVTDYTVSKWGLNALCAEGGYNSLPMTSIWTAMDKMKDVEIEGMPLVRQTMDYLESEGKKEEIQLICGQNNQEAKYASTPQNILYCWGNICISIVIFSCLSVISLEFIDKDKR